MKTYNTAGFGLLPQGLLALLLVFTMAACGDGADDDLHSDSLAVTAPQAQSDTAHYAGNDTTGYLNTNVVQVYLDDFKVEMPNSLPAGPTTFEITNRSQTEHSFEIEGQGLERALESNLPGGTTMQLQADLQPGTYRIYCPVGNHASKGMSMELTVTEAGLASAPAAQETH